MYVCMYEKVERYHTKGKAWSGIKTFWTFLWVSFRTKIMLLTIRLEKPRKASWSLLTAHYCHSIQSTTLLWCLFFVCYFCLFTKHIIFSEYSNFQFLIYNAFFYLCCKHYVFLKLSMLKLDFGFFLSISRFGWTISATYILVKVKKFTIVFISTMSRKCLSILYIVVCLLLVQPIPWTTIKI